MDYVRNKDIKYFLALTEITAGCSATASNRKLAALGQIGEPWSIAFPHLLWQHDNKTSLKQKSGVGQILICPHDAPISLLLHVCDSREVPGVTSACCCCQQRAWQGELAEGAVSMGSTPHLSCQLEL